MRIAIVSPFYPYRGGIAQFSGMLYNTLRERAEVEVFNFSKLYPDLLFPGKSQYVEAGDNTMQAPSLEILSSINPLSWRSTALHINNFNPDVVIFAYWMSFFAPAYMGIIRCLNRQNCKLIALSHNITPHEPKFFDQPLTRAFLNQCDGHLTLSDIVSRDLNKLVDNPLFLQHPHPPYPQFGAAIEPLEAKRILALDTKLKTLLFFGLIRDYKGLDLLIDAFGRLDEGYQLVIAGECYGSFDRYQQQIAKLAQQDRVHLYNEYIADDRVSLFFSAADYLILPYRTATQSGVISAAIHFSLPMVVTPVGELGLSITQSKLGVVAQQPTAEAIEQAIREISSDNHDFQSAFEQERSLNSWDHLADELLLFIKRLD